MSTARNVVAAVLEAVLPDTWTVVTHPRPVPSPNVAMIAPGSPYVTRDDTAYCAHRHGVEVGLYFAANDPDHDLDTLDSVAVDVVLPALEVVPALEGVELQIPRVVEVQNARLLLALFTMSVHVEP